MPPVIIAHRTSPLDEAENSIAGILKSAELGADFVEIDVRLTRDGVPVMLHDALLLRTTLRPWPVSWSTAKGLRRARIRGTRLPVPTFAEAVDALPDHLGFAVDTKDPDAAEAVVSELRNQGKLDRTLLWAQSSRAVQWYVEHAGEEAAEVALLRDALSPEAIDRFLDDAVRLRADAISAHQSTVDLTFIERAHGLGLKVHCWFQDTTTQARLAGLPLDGIVTDWPADARARSRGEGQG